MSVTQSDHHVDEQIAIYALGALPQSEREQLEAHLRQCSRCRALWREEQKVVNTLLYSIEPMEPSPETKRKLMARVDADLASSPARAAPRRDMAPSRPATPWYARLFSPSFAFAALIFLLILGAGLWFWNQYNQNPDQRAIAQILTDPNAQERNVSGTKDAPGAQGKLRADPNQTQAVLTVSGLKPLPSDKTYEFWLIRGDKPVPAGLFNVDNNGSATLLVRASDQIGTYDKLGVTIEDRQGSDTPKGTLVMAAGF